MDTKKLEFSQPAREKITAGVEALAKAVKATLGPRGRNVVIEKHKGSAPHITKDGVTVAKSIALKDSFENLGAQMVKEVALKTAEVAGDGTTTSTVIAEAILKEGIRLVAAGHDPMSIKRGIEKASAKVVEQLKSQSRPVSSTDEIRQVATISANGDKEIGEMIAKAMESVGKDGVITLEEGKGFESELRITSGFEFDRGYLSPHFCNETEKARVVYDNAVVWLINGKVAGTAMLEDMLPVLNYCSNEGLPLVLVAESVEGEILKTMILNYIKGALNCVAIKAPGFGDRRVEMLEDLAALTGATLRDPAEHGSLVKGVQPQELGRCTRIEVTKESTVIVAPDGTEELVEKRVAQIKAQISQETDAWDKERTQQRLGKLTGGVGVILVGGATELEIKEKKDRLEDALSATKAAVEEGVLPGGGVALAKAQLTLRDFSTGNVEEDVGARIVRDAIVSPLIQIAENSGENGNIIVRDVQSKCPNDPAFGYDASTLEFVNMFEAGILDPTKVTRVALQNACSVSGLMLTTECVVALEEDDNKAMPGPQMMM